MKNAPDCCGSLGGVRLQPDLYWSPRPDGSFLDAAYTPLPYRDPRCRAPAGQPTPAAADCRGRGAGRARGRRRPQLAPRNGGAPGGAGRSARDRSRTAPAAGGRLARRAAPAPLHDRRGDRRGDSRPRPVAGARRRHRPRAARHRRGASRLQRPALLREGRDPPRDGRALSGPRLLAAGCGVADRVPARADERRHSSDPRSPDRHVRARRAHDERLDRRRHGRVHGARRADAVRFSGRARGRFHRGDRPVGRSDHDRGAQRSGSGPLHYRRDVGVAGPVPIRAAGVGSRRRDACRDRHGHQILQPVRGRAGAHRRAGTRNHDRAVVASRARAGRIHHLGSGDEPFSVERFSELHPAVVRANRADRRGTLGGAGESGRLLHDDPRPLRTGMAAAVPGCRVRGPRALDPARRDVDLPFVSTALHLVHDRAAGPVPALGVPAGAVRRGGRRLGPRGRDSSPARARERAASWAAASLLDVRHRRARGSRARAARLERSRRLQSAADARDSRARREVAGGARGAGGRRAPRNPLAGSSGVEASCQTSRASAVGAWRRTLRAPGAQLDRRARAVLRERRAAAAVLRAPVPRGCRLVRRPRGLRLRSVRGPEGSSVRGQG